MKKETWKFIIQTIIAILTAILTSLGVRAACAQSGMKREMGHQVARHILHAVTATEIDA